MLWHDTRHGDAPLALVHQEDGRHPRSAPVARLIGRASDGGSGRMALRFPESVNWKIGLSGRRAPTSKVRKTLDATLPHVAAGKAKLLAVFGRSRRPDYP